MEYNVEYSSAECEMYLADKRKLIIHTYDREYTLFKKEYGSYNNCGLVKKKDFDISPKTKLRGYVLVRFDYSDDFKVELIREEELERYIKKYTNLENKILKGNQEEESRWQELQELRRDVRSNRSALTKLLQIDEEKLGRDDLIKFNNFLISVTEKLEKGLSTDNIEIKETKATMLTNKNSRISLYKSKIDKYINEGKFQSINRLCKDLKINRQTLYNYKLDEYIKEILSLLRITI